MRTGRHSDYKPKPSQNAGDSESPNPDGHNKLSEIYIRVSDTKENTSDLNAVISARIESGAPRRVWTPRDFLDYRSSARYAG